MYDLQTALDERLANLKDRNSKSTQEQMMDCTIKEQILASLKSAGILDKNGKMIDRIS
jgi:hypothetical protein